LKMTLLSRGLKLLNSKAGCSLSALLLYEIDTTNGSLTLRSFRRVLFQLLVPALTTVSLLESKFGFQIVTQLADTRKRPSSHL
jgi:hypothetical protein